MSVGHELLINPSIILLDEPTSGEAHKACILRVWSPAQCLCRHD